MQVSYMSCLFLLISSVVLAQKGHMGSSCEEAAFEQKLEQLLNFTVPTIGIHTLKKWMDEEELLLVDTRSREEYEISHIPGAKLVPYKVFNQSVFEEIDRNKRIVVYCSVGYRSEKLGEKLQEAGFSKVFNVYGSIFEWVNAGYPIENMYGEPTQRLHTYNRNWSKWVKDDIDVKKTW